MASDLGPDGTSLLKISGSGPPDLSSSGPLIIVVEFFDVFHQQVYWESEVGLLPLFFPAFRRQSFLSVNFPFLYTRLGFIHFASYVLVCSS